tara:strand:- start:694 stop:912 length:219 start_codon:yes stop_codon:yes gene_type:complete
MSWLEILKDENYRPEFGKPLKEPITQFCDNCGARITIPKGEIYGQDNAKFCEICEKERNEWIETLNRTGDGE